MSDIDGVKRPLRCLDVGDKDDPHPIVFLGGTAQSIDTFSCHVRAISKSRRLIVPELRCQGETELLSEYATIEQHVQDVAQLLLHLGVHNPLDEKLCRPVDLVGFSFGGRVGAAVAAYRPELVHRLSITGIPLHRPAMGCSIMQSWLEALKLGHVRSCYWSFLVNGYSADFISKYEHQLPKFIQNIERSNPHPQMLVDLLENSLLERDNRVINESYRVSACAELIRCPVQVIAASQDRIAGLDAVRELAEKIGQHATFVEIEGGHLAPFEMPVEWRNHVLNFLSTENRAV
jgi:pimeloyl-ACP methyl ester carboxylesterase